MQQKSSAQKVVKVEKRIFDAQRQPYLSTWSIYGFWGMMAGIAIISAGISFLTTDIEARLAQDDAANVDPITTAGISPQTRSINIAERRKQILESEVQKQKVDDISRVIYRLRSEQISLNNRIAELETILNQTRERTSVLENELKKAPVLNSAPTVIPPLEAPNLNPENTVEISKQPTTGTVTINKTAPLNKPSRSSSAPPSTLEKEVGDNAGTSVFAKTKPSQNAKVDDTVVGSIDLAQSTRFAIDLGVSSTPGQAKRLWENLQQRRPSTLSRLTPQYIETGNEKGETRIVTGPFLDASDAIRACAALRSVDAFCKTTVFQQ